MNEWEWQLLEEKQLLDQILVDGVSLKCGDRVVLRPRGRSDILDLALAGKIAVIEAIEQDYEGQAHVAVVVEDDPGKDFVGRTLANRLKPLRMIGCGLMAPGTLG